MNAEQAGKERPRAFFALHLSYCANRRRGADLNPLCRVMLTHNLEPAKNTTDKNRTGNYVLYH